MPIVALTLDKVGEDLSWGKGSRPKFIFNTPVSPNSFDWYLFDMCQPNAMKVVDDEILAGKDVHETWVKVCLPHTEWFSDAEISPRTLMTTEISSRYPTRLPCVSFECQAVILLDQLVDTYEAIGNQSSALHTQENPEMSELIGIIHSGGLRGRVCQHQGDASKILRRLCPARHAISQF